MLLSETECWQFRFLLSSLSGPISEELGKPMLVLSATLFSLAPSYQQTLETLIIKWAALFSVKNKESGQNKLQEVINLGRATKI